MPFGRPTKYSEEVTAYILDYLDKCRADPKKIPYQEEVALDLDVDEDTITNWQNATNEDGTHKYPDFFRSIKKLMTLQRLRLYGYTMHKTSAAGSIFQLKVNHDKIETERKQVDGNLTIQTVLYEDDDNNSTEQL